jgi:hypothetical protein
VTRRDLLGPAVGYQRGDGYRGLFTLRGTLGAILVAGACLGAILLIERLLGERVAHAVWQILVPLFFAWRSARVLLGWEREESDAELTPVERRSLRAWAAAGLVLFLLAACHAVYVLLTPHSHFAPE